MESPEEFSEPYERDFSTRHSSRRRMAVICGGLLALAAAGIFWNNFDNSGEVREYGSLEQLEPNVDNELRVGSWNMHNELSARYNEVKEVLEEQELDVLALQEVDAEDARGLQYHLPEWQTTFVVADSKVEPLQGGYGNVLLTRQKLENISSKVIGGTSIGDSVIRFFSGFGVDVAQANTDFTKAKEGVEENRATIAGTIKVQFGDALRDVRIITGHISAQQDFHERQLEEQMDFIKDNIKSGRPLVFAGDMNANPSEFIPEAAKLGMITPETSNTSLSGRTIDFVSYRTEGILGLAKVSVENGHATDHRLIVFSSKTTK